MREDQADTIIERLFSIDEKLDPIVADQKFAVKELYDIRELMVQLENAASRSEK